MGNILITGGAGFIGSHIAEELLENEHRVIIIDNLSTGKLSNLPTNKNLKLYQCDMQQDDLNDIFKQEKPEIVIHLAAQISVANSVKDPTTDAMQNIIGTLKIIEYCKKYNVQKILVASTAAVYGTPQYLPIDENHPTNPMSQYGLSKLTMEKYIQLSGLDYLILRFSNVYGERQTVTGEAGVVTIFENAMKENKPITIYGDGEQVRDFINVKEIAKIISTLIKKGIKSTVLNVSTQKGITINELFESMAEKYSYSQKPIYLDERENDIKVSVLCNKKLKQELMN